MTRAQSTRTPARVVWPIASDSSGARARACAGVRHAPVYYKETKIGTADSDRNYRFRLPSKPLLERLSALLAAKIGIADSDSALGVGLAPAILGAENMGRLALGAVLGHG